VPFTGTILSAISICLLVAGSIVWKERGIVWRAGVICAIMKSISPSSFILGPMIGILSEAFILEAMLMLFRRTSIGFVIGGAIAVCTPLLQQIINLLMMYGIDVARLYAKLYESGARFLKIGHTDPIDLILLLFSLSAILGVCSAFIGMAVGKKTLSNGQGVSDAVPKQTVSKPQPIVKEQQFFVPLLILHFFLIGFILSLQHFPLLPVSILVAAYCTFFIVRYPANSRRLKRLRLWIELATITLLASLLLGGLNVTGFTIGAQMILRAMTIIIAFSSIGVELRNPVVLQWFYRWGLGQMSSAVDVAFEALPVMLSALGEVKRILTNPITSLGHMLATARAWLEQLERNVEKPRVFLLTGEQGSGKTTFLTALASALIDRGIIVGGFTAPVVVESDQRIGYDLVSVHNGERRVLCRTSGIASEIAAGPYKFDPAMITWGSSLMLDSPDTIVYLLDEIGPLELTGGGWSDALHKIISRNQGIVILSVRTSLVDEVIGRWNLQNAVVWNLKEKTTEQAVKLIVETTGGIAEKR
jgi:nucleoside-triphosphatase THEP1